MLQDIENQYIAQLLAHCPISGKNVLEIGCGTGRITSALVDHAYHVMAIDPDATALEYARSTISANNVNFRQTDLLCPLFPPQTFDVVLFSLSLHHIPAAAQLESLRHADNLLDTNGIIAVIEPADGGSLTFAKEQFGAGSGDERKAREAAQKALHRLPGWKPSFTVLFDVLWLFKDMDDFRANMLPNWDCLSPSTRIEVEQFLARHTSPEGITLDAGRQLTILRRKEAT